MPKRVFSLRCPTCKKPVLPRDPEFPFCSDRCRVIDLGKWASGAYVVKGAALDPEQAESRTELERRDLEDGGPHRRSSRKPH